MGKERVVRTLGYLTVLVCWILLSSIAAQAATFTVNTTLDIGDVNLGDGICDSAPLLGVPSNHLCTLRAAIQEANALFGADQIILPALPAPNAYVLTIATELVITGSLTITGGGVSTTIIDGNKAVRPNSGVLRVNSGVTVGISGVTIQNGGRAAIGPGGGGIYNEGTLTLTNSTVSGNSAGNNSGGGIRNSGGTLTLTNSTVRGNNATFDGGGILNLSTFDGGGFLQFAGTVTLTNSTVSGNRAENGGGIFTIGTLKLTNSTVSSNGAERGGGIYILGFGFNVVHSFNSTIVQNSVSISGGGVHVDSGGNFNFQNTVLAGNFRPGDLSDCSGTINSDGNNLMQSLSGCTINGSAPTVAPPVLGPLQNNGGPTRTHAPLPGSPAIDAGNSFGCRNQFGDLLLRDQRGLRRRVDGDRDGTARCDIGAVEFGSGAGVKFNFDVDFDGDGSNDVGVYRDGTWFILRSSDGGATATPWGGLPQDIPVPGDYDGDGKTDVAVYRDAAQSATQALWFIKRSSDGGTSIIQWGGLLQDIPVAGDYDGDGKTDAAVYRDGMWFVLRSFDGGVTANGWGGLPQDVPVPADYDGDGRTDFAVYRDGMWFILLANGGVIGTGWGGLPQDIPVPGDYDGDGKTDLAVYRDGSWFILRSSDGGVTAAGWGGLAQDVLVPGDYDGDRKTDVAVYRDGNWHIVRSSDGGIASIGWGGLPQDIPLSRRND